MSVRQPPDVSLRALVIAAMAAILGAIAWRFPAAVNPMLMVVASFAVFDRLTGDRNAG